MMKRAVILFFVLLSVPGLAYSQEEWGFEKGDWTTTLQGSGTSDNEFDNNIMTGELSGGYLLTDNFELGLKLSMGYTDIQSDDNWWNGSIRAYLDYNFNLGRWRPFLGLNTGYTFGEDVDDYFISGLEGGLKVFVTPSAFIAVSIEYDISYTEEDLFRSNWGNQQGDETEEAVEEGRFAYFLGFGVAF